MPEEVANSGDLTPDKLARLESNAQVFDVSLSGHHVISRADGSVSENPLEIYDKLKSDNVAVAIRMTTIYLAHLLVMAIFWASFYAQLMCVPARNFAPPIELVAIILGIYGGSSSSFISNGIGAWQRWRRRD